MEKARTFQDLIVWRKAHEFVLDVYELSKSFPEEEKFGLTSQFRRAAVSIAANIAEGFKKKGFKDKMRYMNIAQGSLEECRYYLLLIRDLGYSRNIENKLDHLEEVSKILDAYYKGIETNFKK